MKKLLLFFAFAWLLVSSPPGNAQVLNPAYNKLLENMYQKTVPLLSVAEAIKWKTTHSDLVFLDTREKKEYAVSHIKGAYWIGYKDFDLKKLSTISKQTPIIVYCSVGYRSEKVGEKLLKAGYTNVHNLYGSLFEWVNQGQPVYNNQNEPTTQVHTYSKGWGKWLEKGNKVY